MGYKYSKSTTLFYNDDYDYAELPSDVVAVSDATHAKLFQAQSAGAAILPDADGNPTAVENGGRGAVIDLSTVTSESSYIPPNTLAQDAALALPGARQYVYDNYSILNESTPDAWVSYLKALMAISKGTDTTSTSLPEAPTT